MGQYHIPPNAPKPRFLEQYLRDGGNRRKQAQVSVEQVSGLKQLSLSCGPFCTYIHDVPGIHRELDGFCIPIYTQGLRGLLNLLNLRLPNFFKFFAAGGLFTHWVFDGFEQGSVFVINTDFSISVLKPTYNVVQKFIVSYQVGCPRIPLSTHSGKLPQSRREQERDTCQTEGNTSEPVVNHPICGVTVAFIVLAETLPKENFKVSILPVQRQLEGSLLYVPIIATG